MRILAAAAVPLGLLVWGADTVQAQERVDPAALKQRVLPADGQKALEPLEGRWTVDKEIYVGVGTPDKPAKSMGMTTVREWIGDGRYLRDTTTGTVDGQPYFRTGFLGYNTMDRRYEWTTADNSTPIMMIYQAPKDSGVANPIEMSGSFTDPGITGEVNAGKTVGQRTEIRILDTDHHEFRIFFTPPGGKEFLADQMKFTRGN